MSDFVDIALPVPLRRTFTYRTREDDADVPVGTRVAVPFHGRKLAGFVVAHRDDPPEGVKRILRIAGRLELDPVFPEELLRFLSEAARYYFHPIGDVLKAAAPALPSGAFKRLRESGFLEKGEALPGRRIGTRLELYIRRTAAEPERRLGKRQQALLDMLGDDEVAWSTLREKAGSSGRATLRRLKERGLVTLEEREIFADPFFRTPVERDAPLELNAAQTKAVDAIHAVLDVGGAFLLHGVTGSGKTEVYLRVIAEARERNKGALLLVPEIALTPQLVGRFRARFGDEIAVLHSALTERERDDAWRALRRGELRLAVGARSALFAPVPDLGVLVVDEEHDPSFKQEEGFRYHARDMALLRADRAGAVCILGSATPSVESFRRAELGDRLTLLSLPERATAHRLPKVERVDLRRHKRGPTGHPLLSGPLHQAIRTCLDEEGQGILFLNRRGFAPTLRCLDCGAMVECPACSVTLTEHRAAKRLRCHYCDFQMPVPEACPTCQSPNIDPRGLGTEQLEQTLREVFAPARVARLDRDTATGKGALEVLEQLRRREIDLLVGTQMVTKGHDLPGVTLVGVVLADHSLGFPDFRAGERTFQLLAQVAGRAGRGDREGRVLFQTFQPEHPAIAAAADHDYERFFESERETRVELGYPPEGRMIAVRIDAGDEHKARVLADELGRIARAHPAVREGVLQVRGPAPAPIARLRGRWRFRVLVRGERRALREVAGAIAARIDEGVAPVRASVDVDPVSML